MANRNSTTLVLPGNPLGSVLRETAREARRSTRDPNTLQYATDADVAALQAENDAQELEINALQNQNLTQQTQINILLARVVATILVTPGGGVGTWIYPTPYINVPALFATPVSGVPVFCAIFAPTNIQTQFVVWNAGGAGIGGVTVNLMAFSRD